MLLFVVTGAVTGALMVRVLKFLTGGSGQEICFEVGQMGRKEERDGGDGYG